MVLTSRAEATLPAMIALVSESRARLEFEDRFGAVGRRDTDRGIGDKLGWRVTGRAFLVSSGVFIV